MELTKFQSSINEFMLMQTDWIKKLNPLLAKPQSASSILQNVSLTTGNNTINHLLGRKLQGWKIIRQRASASIYDNQDNNSMQSLTLLLVSSAPVVIDLEVF